MRGVRFCILLLAFVTSCQAQEPVQLRQCLFNGDCNAPLICAGGFCRAQCASDRDCTPPDRCRPSDQPGKLVCLGPMTPALCVRDTDCPQPRGVCDRGLCYASCVGDTDCAPVVGLDGEPSVCLHPESHCFRPISTAQETSDASFPRLDVPSADVPAGDGALDAADGLDAPDAVPPDTITSDASDVASDTLADGATDTGCTTCGGDACVDLSSDPNNCGTCGYVCSTTDGGVPGCASGHCVPACAPGRIACGAQCFDPMTTRDHCGTCATSCPIACVAGACSGPVALAASVAIGAGLIFARVNDGTFRAWGTVYMPGFPITSTSISPLAFAPAGLAAGDTLAVGPGQLCVRSAVMATIRCAGTNTSGQLGNGTRTDTTTLTDVALSNVTGVAISGTHACAWRPESSPGANDQTVCWGENRSGELGDGSTASRNAPVTASHVSLTRDVFQVAVGADSSCAIAAPDRSAWCWGAGVSGQLGIGDGAVHAIPVQVIDGTGAPLTGVQSLAAHDTGYCAIVGDSAAAGGGQVWCWGSNTYGEIDPAHCCTVTTSAMRVGTLTGATRVSTSPTHSCAVLSDHSLWCWGANLYGDLGNGTSVPRSGSPPVRVLGPGSLGFFSAVDVVSTFYSTCAIATLPDGNAYCWGAAADFTLGYPGATGMSAPAGRVAF